MAKKKRSRAPRVVRGMEDVTLQKQEFERRFRARFYEKAAGDKTIAEFVDAYLKDEVLTVE